MPKFIFPVLDQKYLFLANLIPQIKIFMFKKKVGTKTNKYSRFNSMAMFTLSVFAENTFFGQIWSKKGEMFD